MGTGPKAAFPVVQDLGYTSPEGRPFFISFFPLLMRMKHFRKLPSAIKKCRTAARHRFINDCFFILSSKLKHSLIFLKKILVNEAAFNIFAKSASLNQQNCDFLIMKSIKQTWRIPFRFFKRRSVVRMYFGEASRMLSKARYSLSSVFGLERMV